MQFDTVPPSLNFRKIRTAQPHHILQLYSQSQAWVKKCSDAQFLIPDRGIKPTGIGLPNAHSTCVGVEVRFWSTPAKGPIHHVSL
jgi:hypothetical protein